METLLKCPFCASSQAEIMNGFSSRGYDMPSLKFYLARCGECGSCGPQSGSEEGAVTLWNKRPLWG